MTRMRSPGFTGRPTPGWFLHYQKIPSNKLKTTILHLKRTSVVFLSGSAAAAAAATIKTRRHRRAFATATTCCCFVAFLAVGWEISWTRVASCCLAFRWAKVLHAKHVWSQMLSYCCTTISLPTSLGQSALLRRHWPESQKDFWCSF